MTNQDVQQFREFVNKLQREDHRPSALNDIKNLIAFKPANEATSTIKTVGITQIVQCLNLPDKIQVDLTCEVLKICFDKFEPGDVVKNYTSHIMYLLRHEKSCVRKIAIDEVYKAASRAVLAVPEYIDVFVAVAQMVSDSDVGVANRAIMITSNLSLEAYNKVLDEMKIGLESDSSSKCNVFEVIVNISCKSSEHLNLCVDNNYIDFMISELNTDDVLYQVNILELLSRLVTTPQGVNYLVKNGALNTIAEYITSLKNNPLRGLLTPAYMKFFGCIAHNYPKETFDKYPVMLDFLIETFDTRDQASLPVALDTLGFIGSTIEGKLCLAALEVREVVTMISDVYINISLFNKTVLAEYIAGNGSLSVDMEEDIKGSKYTQTVENVAQLIINSTSEIKIRALHCFSGLISVNKDHDALKTGPVDHRVTLMTREWFRTLDAKPMENLLDMCKNPFPDIRNASFILLDAVCQHQWGEELVARTAGFVEFLLDRSIVYTEETNEVKFDIIKRLATSGSFDSNVISRFQTYVEQGPFYSESMLEVAMEEGEN